MCTCIKWKCRYDPKCPIHGSLRFINNYKFETMENESSKKRVLHSLNIRINGIKFPLCFPLDINLIEISLDSFKKLHACEFNEATHKFVFSDGNIDIVLCSGGENGGCPSPPELKYFIDTA